MDKINEKWKIIEEFNAYSISNLGRVKKNASDYILISDSKKQNYRIIGLIRAVGGVQVTRSVHRLVAFAFVENPENKPYVNHKNGVKRDNIASNLEWVTGSENMIHANLNNLVSKNFSSAEEIQQLDENDKVINTFRCQIDASDFLNVPQPTISRLLTKKIKTTRAYPGLKLILTPRNEDVIEEIWKDIKGHELYRASNLGRIYNKNSKKYINGGDDGRYKRFAFTRGNAEAIHRIIAITFIENPYNKPYVNHKDGNTRNNRVSNLEWVTQSENMIHAKRL